MNGQWARAKRKAGQQPCPSGKCKSKRWQIVVPTQIICSKTQVNKSPNGLQSQYNILRLYSCLSYLFWLPRCHFYSLSPVLPIEKNIKAEYLLPDLFWCKEWASSLVGTKKIAEEKYCGELCFFPEKHRQACEDSHYPRHWLPLASSLENSRKSVRWVELLATILLTDFCH